MDWRSMLDEADTALCVLVHLSPKQCTKGKWRAFKHVFLGNLNIALVDIIMACILRCPTWTLSVAFEGKSFAMI